MGGGHSSGNFTETSNLIHPVIYIPEASCGIINVINSSGGL